MTGTLSRMVSPAQSWHLLLPVPGMVQREQSIPGARHDDRKGQGTQVLCLQLCLGAGREGLEVPEWEREGLHEGETRAETPQEHGQGRPA